MTFLSTVHINPWRNAGRRMLRNPHLVHGMVLSGLLDPTGSRPLWRLDIDNPHRPALLILTGDKPDWTHIAEQAGWPHADGEHFLVRDYDPLFTHLTIGREFAFRLTANPVQNTLTPTKLTTGQQEQLAAGRTRGFRLDHRTVAHQLDWLLRRTDKLGFTIPNARTEAPAPGLQTDGKPAPDVRVVRREIHRFTKGKGGRRVILTAVTFEGRLAVTDPDRLRQALLHGVGPAKSYGCGLLTLAPPRR